MLDAVMGGPYVELTERDEPAHQERALMSQGDLPTDKQVNQRRRRMSLPSCFCFICHDAGLGE